MLIGGNRGNNHSQDDYYHQERERERESTYYRNSPVRYQEPSYYSSHSNYSNLPYYRHPPISTYNRYSPLWGQPVDNICLFPDAGYEPSPYRHPQSNFRSVQGFHEDPQGRKRGIETREGLEEGGGIREEKRKRT